MYPTSGSFSALPINPPKKNPPRTVTKFLGTDRPRNQMKRIEKHEENGESEQILKDSVLNESEVIPPWAHHSVEENPPRVFLKSSTTPVPKTTPINAQLLSQEQDGSTKKILMTYLIFILVVLPLILLVWGSYQRWPSYLPLPNKVKILIDRIIVQSPLPSNPDMLLSPMLIQLKNLKTVNQQLAISSLHSRTKQKFNVVFSGSVDLTDGEKANWETLMTWSNPGDEFKSHLSGNMVYEKGLLTLKLDKADPSNYFHWDTLTSAPIRFDVNPSPQNSDSLQYTPGKFALTKIRNQKIHQLLKDYFQIIIEKSVVIEKPNEISNYYIIKSQLKQNDTVNFIKELLTIYQENQPKPPISQLALQKFYNQLENLLGVVNIDIYIDKNTLYLKKVEMNTRLFSDSLSKNDDNSSLQLVPEHPFYSIKIKYLIDDFNQPVSIVSPSAQSIPANQINWSQIITYPLLQPLFEKSGF